MWTLAGEDATVVVDLKIDGQFVLADPGSLTVTLRDNNGVAIDDWNKIPLEDTDKSQVSVVVPAALTFLETGVDFASIYVRLDWKTELVPQNSTKTIRLTQFVPLQATEAGVRSRLGALPDEIPDASIDLYEAYHKLLAAYPSLLPLSLKSNIASACIAANNAVELKAALIQIPALAAKLALIQTQENTSVTRMKMDVPKLEESLSSLLDKELQEMEAIFAGQDVYTPVTQLLVVTPIDVITGA